MTTHSVEEMFKREADGVRSDGILSIDEDIE